MQTFVPWPDLKKSAAALDDKRLGKQRSETLVLMYILTGFRIEDTKSEGLTIVPHVPNGWAQHPATRMWRGHEHALCLYQEAVCAEWARRGFRDTCMEKTKLVWVFAGFPGIDDDMPDWWGREDVHYSHRCRLVAKNPEFYRSRFPDADPSKDYVWPV